MRLRPRAISAPVAALVGGAPPSPTPTPTVDLDTFSERGITWNLSAAVPVGQYVSGDYFALSGTVTGALPASIQYDGSYSDAEPYTGRWVHGLMVDPGRDGGTGANPDLTPQGFDSLPPSPAASNGTTELAYDHSKNLDPNVAGRSAISGIKSLVKTSSELTPANIDPSSRGRLANVSVLTLVDAIPPAGSFRRWAGNPDKSPIFFASDIDWSVLPTLAKPAAATLPTAADLIAKLGPFQLYMNQQLFTRGIAPRGVQSSYGADIANDIDQAMMFTMTAGVSEADRKAVGLKLIQAGLDVFDATEFGRRWSSPGFSYGGAHQWFKILMVYAARLLRTAGNTTQLSKMVGWCNGTTSRIFCDDLTLFAIDRERIESTPSGSINTRLGPTGYPDWSENSIDWNARPIGYSNFSLAYEMAYRNMNGYPFISQALITRLLGAEAIWNNPVYFEYCDTLYDKWTLKGQPTDAYFAPFARFFVIDYYTANSPAYTDASAPALVRRAARGRYAWMEFDKNFALASQPAAADLAVTVDGSAVSLASVSTTASATASSGSTNMQYPVIVVANAAGIKVGQRVVCASLRPDTFVVSVSGTTIGLSTTVPAPSFSGVAITFENVFVYDRALVAVLPTPLTADTQPVTIGYTSPVSGYVRSLAGVKLPTVADAAAVNYTGQLPAGPVSKDIAYSGVDPAARQYSGGMVLRSQSIKRFRLSVRFALKEALAIGQNIISASVAATTTFRMYASTTSQLRLIFGGSENQNLNVAGINTLPLDTLATLHMCFDGTQTTQAAAKKASLVWSGGGTVNVNTSDSLGTLTGAWAGDIAAILSQGLYAFANGAGGSPFHGSIREITIGWGDETLPLPANFNDAKFAHDADWGPNGAGPWGQNQFYFAGTLYEWNAGLPNRGNYGAYSLTPRRFVVAGDPDSGLLTDYTAPV